MKRPRYIPVTRAYPDIKAPESKISGMLIFALRFAARLYLVSFIGAAKIRLETQSLFIHAFRRALGGESRCIVAFRHPYGFEPQVLTWFVLYSLRKTASRRGIRLPASPRLRFIYGYEVLRWGGPIARIIMPRLGALPVHHSKVDSRGLAGIYAAIAEGPYPVGIAPEGQVSYTAWNPPRLEPGVIRIGLGAAEQLKKSKKPLPVEILPVTVRLTYSRKAGKTMECLLRKVEKLCGLHNEKPGEDGLTDRFLRCREIILSLNESRYGIVSDPGTPWEERVTVLLKAALDYCAGILGVRKVHQDEHFSRMYYLRQVCWDRIFVPGEETGEKKETEIEQAVGDLRAGEAWHAARHMEIADFTWYFQDPPPEENAPLGRKIEYVQNLWDFANRTMGGAYANRVNIHPRSITIQAEPVISLNAALEEYRQDRKETIRKLLARLQAAYLNLLKAGGEDE
ncbi:MAG: acyltransferase [Treponema sp.]|jgi:1-acyl-sn-glycerol-3-phosphate acyltransferase|nr:acyltransferase [Treponema sp.]